MKNLISILVLITVSISLNAQDYAIVFPSTTRVESKNVNNNRLNDYASDVLLTKDFNYRDFLKSSKNSIVKFQINGKSITQSEFTKILRKGAKKSNSYIEFQQFLDSSYPQFSSVLSNGNKHLIYEKFNKGTFSSYFQDLANNW